jgi:hypothetical protein
MMRAAYKSFTCELTVAKSWARCSLMMAFSATRAGSFTPKDAERVHLGKMRRSLAKTEFRL